ncbi:4-alpha-glucanotransferase [Trichodesmium erythraeum IMS101]|uniref:4-alpha-glucanotransferase n=1 Tax=Trichodesmium erythraeum (strain IMS101) TaxID=203124 RepID=Q116E8_TRIEI|nr:4-alpha-glucanotransferase [Trichodesmium erythraeum GBRTRLIN201]MCH2047986.1 4-alpha-glucanotransferase [Trichodesmium sp. ALOHA_ZT_67]
MLLSRSSGILLHPTSFPSPFGIGDLGQEAYNFVNFLKNSGQKIWQVLPLGPTGFGNSPYQAYSAMAGNPLLISPDKLKDEGWLSEEDFSNIPEFPRDKVDFDSVAQVKSSLLKTAYQNFQKYASEEKKETFNQFSNSKAFWLDDYAFYMALKEAHEGASWHTWDQDIAHRQPQALAEWQQRLADKIQYHKFLQYLFFQQWDQLKSYANQQGIKIFGDVPIYVAHDSADVWSHPEIFSLDSQTSEPSLMAGVPPDYFSETGQLWGNPVYQWDKLEQEDFFWWVQRIQSMLDIVDLIRIDHFLGLVSYWAVPQGETTAKNGTWITAPGRAFFKTIKEKLGKLPVIAEDLGVITTEVEQLRDQFEFPGMKILHFAFDSGSDNLYLPCNYNSANWVVYTGTHDNNTTVGWFNKRSPQEQERVYRFVGNSWGHGIHWDLIRLAMSSVAYMAIFPLQDILGLGEEAIMNQPGVPDGNWSWRYRSEMLTSDISDRLKEVTDIYGRTPTNNED